MVHTLACVAGGWGAGSELLGRRGAGKAKTRAGDSPAPRPQPRKTASYADYMHTLPLFIVGAYMTRSYDPVDPSRNVFLLKWVYSVANTSISIGGGGHGDMSPTIWVGGGILDPERAFP
jgi:hypothetical protein